jgi:hypothetical protein
MFLPAGSSSCLADGSRMRDVILLIVFFMAIVSSLWV